MQTICCAFEDHQYQALEEKLGRQCEMSFAITGGTVIGRRDPSLGVSVDNDLARYETGKIVSRRHASIERRQAFALTEMASINGTYLNGARLEPRQPALPKNRDEIMIGRDGVRLKFVKGERLTE